MTPAPRPIHRETDWCAAFRREHRLVMRLLEAKNAGLIPGVPRHAGLWGRDGRYCFYKTLPCYLHPLTVPMGLAAIEDLLESVEKIKESEAVA